jgi:hypothetical protein
MRGDHVAYGLAHQKRSPVRQFRAYVCAFSIADEGRYEGMHATGGDGGERHERSVIKSDRCDHNERGAN